MTDILQRSSGQMPLVGCSVLYVGSAVPLETVAGLDAFKMPLRQRYTLTDGHLLGIDATLIVYRTGMLVRYTADEASSAWFPIQALHVCAAFKAFRTPAGGLDFAAVDSSLTKDSRHPPVFAFITRRTKGIKVLECHMFVCKSVAETTTLVQACMYAYEHKEGWLDEDPFKHTSDSQLKIVPADPASMYVKSGILSAEGIRDACNVDLLKTEYARVPLQGFLHNNKRELIHKYDVYGYEDNGKQRVGETNFQGQRAVQEPAVSIGQQQPFKGSDSACRTSSASKSSPVTATTGTTQVHYMASDGYYAEVNPCGSMPFVFVPAPYFYPDESRMKQKNKQNKVLKSEKTRNKSKSSKTKTEEENEDEIIEEYYYVRSAYAPTYQSTTVQETKGVRDDGPRRGTMPPHQTGSLQNTSRYTAGGVVDHQYIARSVPNIPNIRDGSKMQQHNLHESFQSSRNINRTDSPNDVEPARNIESGNDQSNRIAVEEPIPDYPTDPTDLYSHTRYDTGFHRRTKPQEMHRFHEEREARSGHYSCVTDKLESPRDGRYPNDNLRVSAESNEHSEAKLPSSESKDKRGYAELIGDLGYLP